MIQIMLQRVVIMKQNEIGDEEYKTNAPGFLLSAGIEKDNGNRNESDYYNPNLTYVGNFLPTFPQT